MDRFAVGPNDESLLASGRPAVEFNHDETLRRLVGTMSDEGGVMSGVGDFFVTDAEIGLEIGPRGEPLYPLIHACTVRVSNAGFQRVVSRLLVEPVDLTYVTVAFVSCRLIPSGAEIVTRVRRGFLDQNVTTRVELTPAGNGSLRVTVVYLRVGFLAASWLLEYLLGAVNQKPGLRQSGPRSIDVDLREILRSRGVPVDLGAGVTAVSSNESELVFVMSRR